MLLRHRDHFFQALEGSTAAVEAVYRRVRRDPRHQDVKLLQDATRADRNFAGWAMCGYKLGPADNEILETLNLRRELDLQKISGPGALSLLRTVHAIQKRLQAATGSAVVIDA